MYNIYKFQENQRTFLSSLFTFSLFTFTSLHNKIDFLTFRSCPVVVWAPLCSRRTLPGSPLASVGSDTELTDAQRPREGLYHKITQDLLGIPAEKISGMLAKKY